MLPSRFFVLCLWLPVLLALAVVWQPGLLWPTLAFDAFLFALALLDALLSRRRAVLVERSFRSVFSVGEKNPVRLVLVQQLGGSLRVDVQLDLPEQMTSPDLPLRVELVSGRPKEVRVHLIPNRRGAAELGRITLRFRSKLGFWTIQKRSGDEESVFVYPDLATIRSYELLARKHRQNSLVKATRKRGGESEFSRLRDYAQGDDHRFVDWRATARRSRLTSREYQLESDQPIMLVLDAGRLMSAEVDGLSQFDHALNAALLLGHVAAKGGDRVGLLCFDEEVRAYLAPESGPKTIQRLVRSIYNIFPRLSESAFSDGLSHLAQRLKQRSLIIIFTELFDDSSAKELAAEVRTLARKHLPVVVVLRDTSLRARAVAKDGSLYSRGAAAELLNFRAGALALLSKSGALVLETEPKELTPRLVTQYLELKARRAL